jgi:membrane protein
MLRALVKIRRAVLAAFAHDLLGSAKAAAYSAIFCFFPAVLVVTTLLAVAPKARDELFASIAELLPSDTIALLHTSFSNHNVRSGPVILIASLISIWAALGMMLSLMEGFRRAYNLPRNEWPFWVERRIALALIPSCLAPMIFATLIVAFGQQIEFWILANTDHVFKPYVLLLWRIVRLAIGLLTTAVVLGVVYHFGTPRRQHWKHVVGGASGAAVIWFLITLLYGFYVRSFAHYSLFYGSVGTLVASLVWLYITSLSILMGAEFNAQFHPKPTAQLSTASISQGTETARSRSFMLKNRE